MTTLKETKFKLQAPFRPAGDQPRAMKKLEQGIEQGYSRQTLLGTTGSGKTFTLANVIAATQKPALVISHNKTLAAQLAQEFREFFPDNAVEYFVSYYDYYQPEAYLPRTDTYIAKDASINEEIDRLRHAALAAVLTRSDVIVVASVSCIYGLGSPANFFDQRLVLQPGEQLSRRQLLQHLTRLQYARNDTGLTRGTYRVRGDTIDIHPAGEDRLLRVESFGPRLDRLAYVDELTGTILEQPSAAVIFPAKLFITSRDQHARALAAIRQELAESVQRFQRQNKLLEAQRLEQRTTYDLEMIEQVGYCSGIENYSRHFDSRAAGQPPATLLDYFRHAYSQNFLVIIDESHMTIPQISGMHGGDKARKDSLIRFGFRLPSARDNRPLTFSEFEDRLPQTIFVSATPAAYERRTSQYIVEQIVRPTGLLDPIINIRPTEHQVDDVIEEIQKRAGKTGASSTPDVNGKTSGVFPAPVKEARGRVLVTTLTKRMAEELATYLVELNIKAAYLHADIGTLERLDILRNLRAGTFDVLVGINLLREGLDLPEVSLVAILDADKEGYLRSDVALIQTMGRAARHEAGAVIMYADVVTGSMQR
ncbi:MAG: excinuclease ABC subunit UvrB, partial [Candidatus Andersenbacteria bacterium]|nr:excinuclease ABC subunit UvrB [Candidatus Andersenbacteria bacterium]